MSLIGCGKPWLPSYRRGLAMNDKRARDYVQSGVRSTKTPVQDCGKSGKRRGALSMLYAIFLMHSTLLMYDFEGRNVNAIGWFCGGGGRMG